MERIKQKEEDKETKNILWVKILILVGLALICIILIIQHRMDQAKPEKKYTHESLMEHDNYYYNSLALAIASEVLEGTPEEEITEMLEIMNYDVSDIRQMYNNLGVDWEKKKIMNKENKYFKFLIEEGVIYEDTTEELPDITMK